MPSLPSRETLIKAKNVTTILFTAMASLLVLHTAYIRLINSKNLLLIVAHAIIILLLIRYRRTSSDQTPQAPLFSFPSLSTQTPLFSFPSFSLNGSPLESDESLHEPVVVQRPEQENDVYIDRRSRDEWSVSRRRERSERTSIMSGEEEVIKMVVHEQTHEDQVTGHLRDESMDDTWRAIVARGKAKPVSLFGSKTLLEKTPLPEMKELATLKRKEKKKKKKKRATSHEQETNTDGWRQRDAIMMSNAEVSRLSEMLIKSQYNRLKIERQESDQRRLLVV